METISVRFEEDFVRELELIMREYHYATKTELIREAVRDKIKNLKKETAIGKQGRPQRNKIYTRADLKF